MKVKMLTIQASAEGTSFSGNIKEVSEEDAIYLVNSRQAILVDDAAPVKPLAKAEPVIEEATPKTPTEVAAFRTNSRRGGRNDAVP